MSNAKLIHLLNILKTSATNTYKARAFETATQELSKLKYKITNNTLNRLQDDIAAKRITGIGTGIYDRIVEYCNTNTIAEAQQVIEDEEAIHELTKIRGVGTNLAHEWINNGIRDLQDVKRASSQGQLALTTEQKYGVLYYTDLNQRIPRAQVAQIAEHIRVELQDTNKILHFDIVGSYRRGLPNSGDVDILICARDPNNDKSQYDIKNIVHQAIWRTHCIDIIDDGDYMITSLIEWRGKVRQCDILLTVPSEYIAALIYFTGSKNFNIQLRNRAKKMGLKLNQHGLFNGPTMIPLKTEADLFRALGLKYVAPEKRI